VPGDIPDVAHHGFDYNRWLGTHEWLILSGGPSSEPSGEGQY